MADVINISLGISNDTDSEFGNGYDAARFDEIEVSIGVAVQGRGGLGSTIVVAAGNQRAANYDINADDPTNDTRQVVVAGVDQNGFVSSYSSYGSAILVSAFGTPGEVVTTDRTGAGGYVSGDFTNFNGTSAAAPMVSGVVSLMYDANPDLGWRDVQSILANSARHVGSAVGTARAGNERYEWGWNGADTWNGGGLHFSKDYGHGLVDALAAVRLAETWLLTGTGSVAQTSGNESVNFVDMLNSPTVIPDSNSTGLTFSGGVGTNHEVERVTVQMSFSTTWTGDLEVYVTSPEGTVSELIADTGDGNDFNGTWTFESQAFRGERASGLWTVRVADDTGGDLLTVSDILLRTFGRNSSNDRYVFTDEYSNYAGTGGHKTAIADVNLGTDIVNAAAVSSPSTIRLDGVAGSIDGVAVSFAPNIENAIGGDGRDTLIGNSGANALWGRRGDDILIGGFGVDSLFGGEGNDYYVIDSAQDIVSDIGAVGITGGFDTIEAPFDYTLPSFIENLVLQGGTAGTGNDLRNRIDGNGASNILSGLAEADFLFGYGGDDLLDGGSGNDLMVGGEDNDRYRVDHVGDRITEMAGGGLDTIEAFIDETLADHVENLVLQGGTTATGNTEHNRIDGHGSDSTLSGLEGNDLIFGYGGEDVLDGGLHADTMLGGPGNDRYILDNGGDVVIESGGEGLDTIVAFLDHTIEANVENMILEGGVFGTGNVEHNRIDGHGSANTLSGLGGKDELFGYGGSDTLEGGADADTLNGGADADTMLGGIGDDRYYVHDAGDVVTENAGGGLDTVVAFLSYVLAVNAENLILEAGTTATGNAEHNRIDGHGADSTLNGESGNDLLLGYGGDDILDGGLNADRLIGGLNHDRYIVDNGGDLVIELIGEGIDTIIALLDHTIEDNVENMNLQSGVFGTGNALANMLDGNSAANVLKGLGGKDVITGFGGNDTLNGGGDDDRFVLTNGTGNDTIADMQGGASSGDVIDVRAFGFGSFGAVMAATTNVNGGALIQLDGDDSVFVQNMSRSQFDANDFLLA